MFESHCSRDFKPSLDAREREQMLLLSCIYVFAPWNEIYKIRDLIITRGRCRGGCKGGSQLTVLQIRQAFPIIYLQQSPGLVSTLFLPK
jgi:hypothetical protein